MSSKWWGLDKLKAFFEKGKEDFGNPEVVIGGAENGCLDLRWGQTLWLRWSWSDPWSVRLEKADEYSLLGAAISGLTIDGIDWEHHIVLQEEGNSWVYVSTRLKDYSGKVKSNAIVQCLTEEGRWLQKALNAGKEVVSSADFPS
jgi:hypothetical protein